MPTKRWVLIYCFFLLIQVTRLSAQTFVSLDCRGGSSGVPVWQSPESFVKMRTLQCGEEFTVLAQDKMFAKIRTNDNEEGYIGMFNLSHTRQWKAKDHYEHGERRLQQNELYRAYEDFSRAASMEPQNRKYQKRLAEVGKKASAMAETSGRNEMDVNPKGAERWLRDALRYDGSNTSAAEVLELLHQRILTAAIRANEAHSLLARGDLNSAEDIATSLRPYRESVTTIPDLEKEISGAKRAFSARLLLGRGEIDRALTELSQAEKEAPNSSVVKDISKKLRLEFSDRLATRAEPAPIDTPTVLLEKTRTARNAVIIDDTNERALEVLNNASRALVERLVEKVGGFIGELDTPAANRILLESVRSIEPPLKLEGPLDTHVAGELARKRRAFADFFQERVLYQPEESRFEALAYPAIRLRILIENVGNCLPPIRKEAIEKALTMALGRTVRIEDRDWDLTIALKSFSCRANDVPKQSVQRTNSTYVAGYNEIANPEYLQVQADLTAAQVQLEKMRLIGQIRPGFAATYAIFAAQGKVGRLQIALANTPPYITQPIVQQYQYEKFQAYRSYGVESFLQVYGRPGNVQFVTERQLSFIAEHRGDGISGVLPQDQTGERNIEVSLPSMDEHVKGAWQGFTRALDAGVREMLGGYFATLSMDEKRGEAERLSSLLYLFDLANGTKYEADHERLAAPIKNVLLTVPEGVIPLLKSLSLSVPEQGMIADAAVDSRGTAPSTPIESVMEGTVALETDKGEGSGFFLTNACLVVTNAHVVTGAETVIIRTASRKLFTGQILSEDADRDLALLRSNARTCTPLALDDSGAVAVSQDIWVIGNPLGLSGTVTKGIVSAIRTLDGIRFLQVDATVNPGNSGGPVVTRSGRVVGVTTFKVKGYEGLNFAVSSSEVAKAFGQFFR